MRTGENTPFVVSIFSGEAHIFDTFGKML